MLRVHHLNNSRSQRVLWLLEELGCAYEVVPHGRDPATMMAPAALVGVHPLGKSPVIEADGVVLAETGAIVEYIVETRGKGRMQPPAGTPEHLRCRYWLHYAEGSLMAPLTMRLLFDQIERAPVNFLIRKIIQGLARSVKAGYIDKQIGRHLDYLEAELARSAWFAGDALSIADIMMSFPVQVAAAQGVLGTRPRLRAWLAAVEAREAWARGVARGGPYTLSGLA